MPNPYFMCAMSKAQLKSERDIYVRSQQEWPWDERKPVALFRGAIGIEHGEENKMPPEDHPRGKLINLVGNLTDLFDVGHTGYDKSAVHDDDSEISFKPAWDNFNWARKEGI